jgi:hypothetical protein
MTENALSVFFFQNSTVQQPTLVRTWVSLPISRRLQAQRFCACSSFCVNVSLCLRRSPTSAPLNPSSGIAIPTARTGPNLILRVHVVGASTPCSHSTVRVPQGYYELRPLPSLTAIDSIPMAKALLKCPRGHCNAFHVARQVSERRHVIKSASSRTHSSSPAGGIGTWRGPLQ